MKQQALAKLFFRELEKIHDREGFSDRDKTATLYRLLNKLFVEATSEERLHFATLFTRIAYAGHAFNLSRQLQFYIHEFRKRAREVLHQSADESALPTIYQLGLKALAESVAAIYQQPIPEGIQQLLPPDNFYSTTPTPIQQFITVLRVAILAIDPATYRMTVRSEEHAAQDLIVEYNIADRNENFNSSIRALQTYFELPVVVNLIDVEVGQDNVYRPRAFVIEPDYLVDVSAIAESFNDFGAEPLLYHLNK